MFCSPRPVGVVPNRLTWDRVMDSCLVYTEAAWYLQGLLNIMGIEAGKGGAAAWVRSDVPKNHQTQYSHSKKQQKTILLQE